MEDLLKILIVDDEPEAREIAQIYACRRARGLKVVGMAGHVDEAITTGEKGAPSPGSSGYTDA